MENVGINRRKYPRYNTELDVYFSVEYDVAIRVEFQVIDNHEEGNSVPKYFGLCNNVSAEGILIVSKKQLLRGDILILDVYDPIVKNPVKMEGLVRWCEKCPGDSRVQEMFYAGVQIASVNGRSVMDSIYLDKKYMVVWSAVLESLFGTFETIKSLSPKK